MWLINIVFLQLPEKEGFPVIRVICHESVIYVTGYVSHGREAQGLLPRITRQSETFLMATGFRCRMLAIYQSLLLFLGLTYRASPLLWDKYWIISRWLTAYSRCCIDVHRSSCIWSSCWLREFIHVAVVYANEMPLFIGNIEFYIQSTINF